MKFFYFYLLLLTSLSSCTKEIKIDFDDKNILPVVNCIFNSDSVFKVQISLSKQITDDNNYFVDNARATILTDDGNTINFTYTGENGIYKSTERPFVGILYKLKVSIPEFKDIFAEDKIPLPTQIFNTEYYSEYNTASGEDISMLKITFQDDIAEENYYDIPCDYWGQQIAEPILIAEGDLSYNPKSFYFSDKLINGDLYELKIPFSEYEKLEFRTTSKNYYFFRKFWTRHYHNQQNDENASALNDYDIFSLLLIGEPIEMFTNIENGYGIFAGYSYNKK